MMRVLTRIVPSKIDGLGTFAATAIKNGTVVWTYAEPTDYRLKEVPQELKAFLDRYGYKPLGKDYYEACGDAAMFINHSDTPNLTSNAADGNMVANRDIAAGEELTCNYREFDDAPESGGQLI